MTTLGAVIISRNDNYGGDLDKKLIYCLSSFINAMDEVYYIDWNSPDDKPLINEIRNSLPQTGKLHSIVISQKLAKELTNYDPEVQNCVEVLARNIGIRRINFDIDYIISTNSDIMCSTRANVLEGIKDWQTFHTIARSNIEFGQVSSIEYTPGSPEIAQWALTHFKGWNQFGSGSPLGPRDKWSLISCPGDFQLAHRGTWYDIRGFEESLVYRGYTDSNVQRKADYYGYKQALVRDIVALHFNHYPGSGSTGGNSAKWNTDECLFNFEGTTNKDTWGFSDINFEEEII